MRLLPGWEPRPEYGAGQEYDEEGNLLNPIFTPADREDRIARQMAANDLGPSGYANLPEAVLPTETLSFDTTGPSASEAATPLAPVPRDTAPVYTPATTPPSTAS